MEAQSDQDLQAKFTAADLGALAHLYRGELYQTKGNVHVHYNDGDKPLVLLWCYAPPGDLPTR